MEVADLGKDNLDSDGRPKQWTHIHIEHGVAIQNSFPTRKRCVYSPHTRPAPPVVEPQPDVDCISDPRHKLVVCSLRVEFVPRAGQHMGTVAAFDDEEET